MGCSVSSSGWRVYGFRAAGCSADGGLTYKALMLGSKQLALVTEFSDVTWVSEEGLRLTAGALALPKQS